MTYAEALRLMPRCPICGKKAYISGRRVEGLFMGYDGGCPSFRRYDGVHGITEAFDVRRPDVNGLTIEEVVKAWRIYCDKMKSGDDMSYRLSPRERRNMFKVVEASQEGE